MDYAFLYREPLINWLLDDKETYRPNEKLRWWGGHFETVGYKEVSGGATEKHSRFFEMATLLPERPETHHGTQAISS
ncbi:hypothetical protein SAMN05660479_02767 [Microbulbifer thermotolerans]|nr:hypothetical protein SAMN05660479_02767 [Microbulbifer thermotolerans]